MFKKSAEIIPETQIQLKEEYETPSRKKSQQNLECAKLKLDQCMDEISSPLPEPERKKLNSLLSEYNQAANTHIKALTDELTKSICSNEQARSQLFQERENETVLIEAMGNLEQQISDITGYSSDFSLSVFIPEIRRVFGSPTKTITPLPESEILTRTVSQESKTKTPGLLKNGQEVGETNHKVPL